MSPLVSFVFTLCYDFYMHLRHIIYVATLASFAVAPLVNAAQVFPGVPAFVVSVTDGDTIVVKMGKTLEKVRLIGIDAPELHDKKTSAVRCYARDARAKLRTLLLHKNVFLVRDPLTHNRDIYGRLLRTVMLGSVSINEQLVHDGFARVYTRFEFSGKSIYLEKQKKSQAGERGLWNKKNCR